MKRTLPLLAIVLLLGLGIFGLGISFAQSEPATDEAARPAIESRADLELPGDNLEPVELAGSCHASFDCDDGTTRQCTGSSTCKVLSNGVECDGTQNLCASGNGSCTATTDCSQCTATVSCTSSSGDCQVFEGSGVRCDDTYRLCFRPCGPEIPPNP
jgi:hypothetical protein